MSSFTLWVVRHGQTLYNKKNIIQGQLDIPLSDVGLEQARLVGLSLWQQKFTHVYSSDLLRARQTAEEIVKQNDQFVGTIITDTRLRERKFGECEGKILSELKRDAANAGKCLAEFCPPGGETLKQLHDRAVVFFKDLCLAMRTNRDSNRNISSSSPSNGREKCPEIQDGSGTIGTTACNGELSSVSHVDSVTKSSEIDASNSGSNSIGGQPANNVLLVSHGGFIKELLQHLFLDLHCHMEGGREAAFRLAPNASLSKFLVSMDHSGERPSVSCLLLHCRRHLDGSAEQRPDEDVAL